MEQMFTANGSVPCEQVRSRFQLSSHFEEQKLNPKPAERNQGSKLRQTNLSQGLHPRLSLTCKFYLSVVSNLMLQKSDHENFQSGFSIDRRSFS
jgi:hypothetical protein